MDSFENVIQQIVDKKINRANGMRALGIKDYRVFYDKISKLENKTLYNQYIIAFPYKLKKYENIDFEYLLLEMMFYGYTQEETVEKNNTSVKTLQRRMKELKKEGNDVYYLYEKYKSRRNLNKIEKEELEADIEEKYEEKRFNEVEINNSSKDVEDRIGKLTNLETVIFKLIENNNDISSNEISRIIRKRRRNNKKANDST